MAFYLNKNMVDGVEELPRLTEEEFLAIPVAERPRIWVKRNATETDRGITAEDVQYDSSNNVKQKIDSVASNQYYHKGDSYTLNVSNLMLAGRTGWSGKDFYFGIFLDKPAGSDVTGADITFGSGGSVYLVSYNQAIDISNTSRTNTLYVSADRRTMSLKMAFSTAPLSITDGIVNLMLNKQTTITFT